MKFTYLKLFSIQFDFLFPEMKFTNFKGFSSRAFFPHGIFGALHLQGTLTVPEE